MEKLRKERHPGVWYSGGLESDGIGSWGVDRGLWLRWRKEKKEAARHRQEKGEANETRKVVIVQGSVEPRKRH